MNQPQSNGQWGTPPAQPGGQDAQWNTPPSTSGWGQPSSASSWDDLPPAAPAAPAAAGGWDAPPAAQPPAPAPAPAITVTPKGKKSSRLPRVSAGSGSAGAAPHKALIPSLVAGGLSLLIAIVVVIISTATEPLWGILSFVAWALAGLVGITLLSRFFRAEAEARANGMLIAPPIQHQMYMATLALLGVSIVFSAVEIALFIGKM